MARSITQRYRSWVVAQIKKASTIDGVKRLTELMPLDPLVVAAGNARWDELIAEALAHASSSHECMRVFEGSRPDSPARLAAEEKWAALALEFLAKTPDANVHMLVVVNQSPVNSKAWCFGIERYLAKCDNTEQIHRVDKYLFASGANPSPELLRKYHVSLASLARTAKEAVIAFRGLTGTGIFADDAMKVWDRLSLAEVITARGDIELVNACRAAREGSEARRRGQERWEAMQMNQIRATHLHPNDLRSSLINLLHGLDDYSDLQTEAVRQEACRKLIELCVSTEEAWMVFGYLPKDSPDLAEAACQRLLDLSLTLDDCLDAFPSVEELSDDWYTAIFKRALGLCHTPGDANSLEKKVVNRPKLALEAKQKLSKLLTAAGH